MGYYYNSFSVIPFCFALSNHIKRLIWTVFANFFKEDLQMCHAARRCCKPRPKLSANERNKGKQQKKLLFLKKKIAKNFDFIVRLSISMIQNKIVLYMLMMNYNEFQ